MFGKMLLELHDTSVWFHISISPSVRLMFFHTSSVTTWLMSDITKHSPPLLFHSTPSPSNTRVLPPLTLQHGTPPIAATAQIHLTICQAYCPRLYRPHRMFLVELATQLV